MQHRLFTLMLTVVLAVGLAACGSDSNDDAGSDAGSPTTTAIGGDTAAAGITIANFTFTTDPVKAGATVTVANEDTTTHSVVSDDEVDQFGTESDVAAGSSGTITAPPRPGSYPFHCGIHSNMKATLVVE